MGKHNNKKRGERRRKLKKMGTDPPIKIKTFPLGVSENHKVLIVGDGDLSFGKAFSALFPQSTMIATTYEGVSAGTPDRARNQSIILSSSTNASVEFGIDATNLSRHFPDTLFDRIIFNFPHSGQQRVHVNRLLVENFLNSAYKHLTPDGQVWVTLKWIPPYSHWNLLEFASDAGLRVLKSVPFDPRWFPGYRHNTTDPHAKKLKVSRACRTFVLIL